MASVLMSQPAAGLPAPAVTSKRANKVLAGQYEVSVKLGAGLQGQVYLGKDMQSGNLVALKCMDRAAIEANPKVMQNVERELQAMTKVSEHSGVVQALDIKWKAEWPRSNGGVKPIILLVLELASKSELFDFAMHTGPFPEIVAQHYFKQLASTLQFCHSKGVYHRDLKPENLLINESYNLKVADFGLAAVTEDANGIVSVLKTKCGTKGYMAPEVLERNAGYHGGPADVWSSAVILFIMVAGFPPLAVAQRGDWWFDRIRNRQWSHFWAAHERSATFTPAFKDLIQNMFNANPSERATVDEILQHAWLNGEAIEEATVQAEMARRWSVVESKKSAERTKAAESSTGDLDLLGGGVTRGADGPSAAPLPAVPALSSGHACSFYVPGAAGDIADALKLALGTAGASSVQANKADGDVFVQGVVSGMGVVATVFEDAGAHLVSFAPAAVAADGSVLSDDDEGDFMGTEADFRAVVASVQAEMTGAAAASAVGAMPEAPDAAAADGGDSFSELM